MNHWLYGLPYHPINENQPPRRFIPLDRLKFIAIVIGLTAIVIVLGYSITLIVVSKTKQQRSGSETISTAISIETTKNRPGSETMSTALIETTKKQPVIRLTPPGIKSYNKISSNIADVLRIKSLSHFTVEIYASIYDFLVL